MQGAPAPAPAHTEGRDGCIACMTFSLLQEGTKGVEIVSLCDPGQVSASLSVSVANEAFSNKCSYRNVEYKLPKHMYAHLKQILLLLFFLFCSRFIFHDLQLLQ